MKKVIAFLALLFLISCNNAIVDHLEQNPDTSYVPSSELTEKQAEAILLLYLDQFESESNTKSTTNRIVGVEKINCGFSDYQLKSGLKTNSNSEELSIYNFTISSGNTKGFALIPADIRCGEVIAFSPYGSLNDTIFNKGLAYWYNYSLKDYLINKINYFETHVRPKEVSNTKASISPENTLSPGQTVLASSSWHYGTNYDTVYHYYTKYSEYLVNHPQKINLRWNQTAPYNNRFPDLNCSGVTRKAYAGCGTVAIAQILTHYRKSTTNYDWSVLTATPTISTTNVGGANEVSRLMKDISDVISTNIACDGTSSTFTTCIKYLKQKSFSYVKDIEVRPGYDNIEETLYNQFGLNRVVIMRGTNPDTGGGHAWVIDGYQKCSADLYTQTIIYNKKTGSVISDTGLVWSWVNLLKPYQDRFHFNWGHGGAGDGWFSLFYVRDNETSEYRTNYRAITDIY